MKKIINSSKLWLAGMNSMDDLYIEDLCVKISKYDRSITIVDLSNASKSGKICKEWKICVNYHCNDFYNPAELCEAVTGCTDIVNIVNALRSDFNDYAEFKNGDICLYVRDCKGVDVFTPFASVNPVKVPKKWTLSHIWKAIYSGQIVAARRDYRYTDDYAYDNATNFGEGELDGDSLADLAEKIIESNYSGWWVNLNRIDENGNYIIDLGLHSFEGWTLVFNPDAHCGIVNTFENLGLDTPEDLLNLVLDFSQSDNDPDPDNDPSGKPDKLYSDFDNKFRQMRITNITFSGCKNAAAEPAEPEQADPEQLDFDSCGGSAAEPATPATVPTPCPIDEDAAKRGKESYSFSSYVPGSATAAYTAQVARVAAAADEIKPQLAAEDSEKLDRLVNRYATKLADWTNRKNRCDASYPSWMISGPANYNMRKHEKQMSRLDKLFAEYAEIEQLESKILNFAAVDHPIMSGDENALDKLREKVAELTACREKMKQENAAARKQGKNLPHTSWELSNSLQNLNRYKERLAALEKVKASETSEQIAADGVKVVRNTDLMRLQLIFDGKPSDEVRAVLKKNAFKWSPKNSAWQRQLTPNAERSLETVLKAIN